MPLRKTAAWCGSCLALIISVATAATPVQAQQLIYGAYLTPKHKIIADILPPAFEKLAKGDEPQNWRIAPGGQIIGARNAISGLKGGLADAGFVIPAFARADLPANAVLFDYIGHGSDPVASTGATLETIFKNCERCLEEYREQGTILLAATSASPNVLMCGDKVSTAADVKGKKVRAIAAMAGVAKELGATPVNVPAPEGATAIQRGTIDCVMGPATWMESYGYMDVVKSVITEPIGITKSIGLFVMNEASWNRLSEKQQARLKEQMPMLSASTLLDAYIADHDEVIAAAKEQGVSFSEGDADYKAAIDRYREREADEVDARSKEIGFDGARQIIETYEKLYPEWEKLAKEIDGDTEKFAEALRERVYSE